MILSIRNPNTMTDGARLTEVGAILARGYLRLVKSRHESLKELDVTCPPTAECPSPTNGVRPKAERRSA